MKSKQYLTKLAAVLVSMISLVAMPLYATEQKATLKVEDAVKSALSYSNQMSINSKTNETLKEQMKLDNSTTYYQYQNIYLRKAQNEQQRKMLEDKIAMDVITKYNSIIIFEKEIQQISKNAEISSKELQQMSIKNKRGLVNPIMYQSKEIEAANLKASKAAKEEELKNAQTYFKVVTGKDVTKYTLDDMIHYEPFRITTSVEGYISSKIDIYLQYDKELAKLNQENVPVELGYIKYITDKSTAESATLSLEDTQKTLKQTLINKYSSLVNLEEQINSLQSQLDLLDKKLKSVEMRYNAGMVSVVEYNKQEVAKQNVEIERLKLINSYNSLKETIQKPWVASLQ